MKFSTWLASFSSVRAAMTRDLQIVAPDTPLCQAIARLSQTPDCLLVVEEGQLVGLLHDRSVVQFMAGGNDCQQAITAAAMIQPTFALPETRCQDVFYLLHYLQQHSIRYLPIVDADNRPTGLVTETRLWNSLATNGLALLKDTSNYQQMGKALSQSERHFRASWENAFDAVLWVATGGTILGASPNIGNILGWTWEELIGTNAVDRIHPQDLQSVISRQVKLFKAPGQPTTSQVRVKCKYGLWRWIEATACNLLGDPNIGAIVINLRDLTDRRQAEEALRMSERRYIALAEAVPVGILRIHLDGKCFYVNHRYCTITGMTPQEAYRCWHSCLHPEDRERVLSEWQQAVQQGIPLAIEFRVLRPDRACTWVEGQVRMEGDETGQRLSYIGTLTDISDRKQAELACSQSEARFQAIVAYCPNLFVLYDPQRRFQFVSATILERTGQREADWIERRDEDLLPVEITDGYLPFLKQAIASRTVQEGQYSWFLSPVGECTFKFWYIPLLDRQGDIYQVMGIGQDITASQRVETALRESEALLRAMFERSVVGFVICDLNGRFVRANQAYQQMVGYSEEVLQRMQFTDLTVAEDSPYNLMLFDQIIRGEREFYQLEKRYHSREGTSIWVRVTASLIPPTDGRSQLVMAIVENIHDRKQAELALQKLNQELEVRVQERTRELMRSQIILRQREQEFRTLVENSPDLIYRIDRDFRYAYINPEAERTSGIPNTKLLGKALHESGFPSDRSALWQPTIQQVFETGQEQTIESCIQLSGGLLHYHIRLVPELTEDGAIASVLAVARDITAVKQAEEQLKNSLIEKEILLKEIHHRVKNNLYIVSSLLELQAETLPDPTLTSLLRESQVRIHSMAQIHEKLYLSESLSQIDFRAYLEDLGTSLLESYYLTSERIQLQIQAEPISLNVETATPCGLIVTELISNSLKHAFPQNRPGLIRVSCCQKPDRRIQLTVQDNGIGFPEGLDLKNINSMGFQVILTLVKQLKASFWLERSPGTKFYLEFTQLNYRKRI